MKGLAGSRPGHRGFDLRHHLAEPEELLPPVALPPVLLLPGGVPLSLPGLAPGMPDVPLVPLVPDVPEVPEVPLFSPDLSPPAPGLAPGVVLPVPEVPPVPGEVGEPGDDGDDSEGGGGVAGADWLGVVVPVDPLSFSSPPPPPPRLQAATLIVSRPRNISVFVACSLGFITIPFN